MKKSLIRIVVPLMLALGLVGQVRAVDLVNNIDVYSKLFTNKPIGAVFDVPFDFQLSEAATLSGDFSSILSSIKFKEFSITDSDSVVVNTSAVPSFSVFLQAGSYKLGVEGSILSNPAGFAGLMSAVPIPEPAEWMMILAGVAMMGVVVSRRRTRN